MMIQKVPSDRLEESGDKGEPSSANVILPFSTSIHPSSALLPPQLPAPVISSLYTHRHEHPREPHLLLLCRSLTLTGHPLRALPNPR